MIGGAERITTQIHTREQPSKAYNTIVKQHTKMSHTTYTLYTVYPLIAAHLIVCALHTYMYMQVTSRGVHVHTYMCICTTLALRLPVVQKLTSVVV